MVKGKGLKVKCWFAALGCVFALMALPCKIAYGEGVVIGGYDVVKIAKETLVNLEEKKVISESSVKELNAYLKLQSEDPLVSGTSIIEFYSNLGKLLVEKNVASHEDIEAANKTASTSGGIKIGGYNPVVLSASYLNILVQKGIISLPTAQSIMDSSKTE